LRLLLDTHALLWAIGKRDELVTNARSAIVDPDNEVLVSAASTWEIAIKQAQGKLTTTGDIPAELAAAGFAPLPISIEHSLAASGLPRHHGDPFDRMLIAQAQLETLTVVTRDPRFALYDVEVLAA
jgi:PIN domain nuclease of toxin-antitoxin system